MLVVKSVVEAENPNRGILSKLHTVLLLPLLVDDGVLVIIV